MNLLRRGVLQHLLRSRPNYLLCVSPIAYDGRLGFTLLRSNEVLVVGDDVEGVIYGGRVTEEGLICIHTGVLLRTIICLWTLLLGFWSLMSSLTLLVSYDGFGSLSNRYYYDSFTDY